MLVGDWEKKHLPVENSALALDLFLLISYNTLIDKPLTLKLLFHSTVFSEAGIRKHLRRWVDGDWCLLVGDVRDKRLKYVVAQPKMLLALSDYLKVLNGKYKKSARPSITTPPTVVLIDTRSPRQPTSTVDPLKPNLTQRFLRSG